MAPTRENSKKGIPGSNFFQDNSWAIPLMVFLVSFVIRILYIFIFMDPTSYASFTDMSGYDWRAENFILGKELFMPAAQPPFYHMFLGSIYWIFTALGVHALKLKLMVAVHSALSSLAAVFLYLVAKKAFGNTAALLAALLFAFSYQTIYMDAWLMSENLFIPLVLASVYLLVCRLERRSDYALLGLIVGLTTITRVMGGLLFPIFVLWIWQYEKKKYAKENLLLFSLAFFTVVVAQISANYIYTDGQVAFITTNGGHNFAMLHCQYDALYTHSVENGQPITAFFEPVAYLNLTRDNVLNTNVSWTNQMYYYQMGWECFKKDPVGRLLDFRNIYDIFNSMTFPNAALPPFSKEVIYQFALFTIAKFFNYFILIPLSLFYIVSGKGNRKYAILLAAIFVSYLAVAQVTSVGEERYLLPLYFTFFMLGAAGLEKIISGK